MNVRERLRTKPLAWASRYGTFIYVGTPSVVNYYGPFNRGTLVRRRSAHREVQSVRTQAVPRPFIRLLTESLLCPHPLPFNDLGRDEGPAPDGPRWRCWEKQWSSLPSSASVSPAGERGFLKPHPGSESQNDLSGHSHSRDGISWEVRTSVIRLLNQCPTLYLVNNAR